MMRFEAVSACNALFATLRDDFTVSRRAGRCVLQVLLACVQPRENTAIKGKVRNSIYLLLFLRLITTVVSAAFVCSYSVCRTVDAGGFPWERLSCSLRR